MGKVAPRALLILSKHRTTELHPQLSFKAIWEWVWVVKACSGVCVGQGITGRASFFPSTMRVLRIELRQVIRLSHKHIYPLSPPGGPLSSFETVLYGGLGRSAAAYR